MLPDFATPADAPQWLLDLTNKPLRPPRAAPENVVFDTPAALDQGQALIDLWRSHGDVPLTGKRNEHAFRCFAELKDLALSPGAALALYEQLYAPGAGGDPPDHPSDHDDVISRLWAGQTGDNPIGSKLLPTASEAIGDLVEPHIVRPRWRFIEVDEPLDAKPISYWDANGNFPEVPGGAVGLLISGYGTLKTQHAIAMSLDCPRQPRILYCMGEGAGGMGARLNAIMLSRGLSRDDIRGRLKLAEVPTISDVQDFESFLLWLRESAKDWRPDIIWLDTLATALGPVDDSNAIAGWYLTANGPVGKLAKDRNCLVMFCHHTNWEGQEGKGVIRGRGTSAIEGNCSVSLTLERNRKARVTKINRKRARDGKDGEEYNTYFEVVDIAGGIPVPQQISASLYDMLSGAGDQINLAKVEHALDTLQAHGEDKGVRSHVLVAAIYEKVRQQHTPEDWDQALNRMVRTLEKQRGALTGTNNAALGGGTEGRPLLWYR